MQMTNDYEKALRHLELNYRVPLIKLTALWMSSALKECLLLSL